jgi:uncharacterized protein YjbJ (UPF0337 family)
MKPRSKDTPEGKMHQVKVNNQDDIWKIVKIRDLEAEGKSEKIDEKVQEKLGRVEKEVAFAHENALVARPMAYPLMLINLK